MNSCLKTQSGLDWHRVPPSRPFFRVQFSPVIDKPKYYVVLYHWTVTIFLISYRLISHEIISHPMKLWWFNNLNCWAIKGDYSPLTIMIPSAWSQWDPYNLYNYPDPIVMMALPWLLMIYEAIDPPWPASDASHGKYAWHGATNEIPRKSGMTCQENPRFIDHVPSYEPSCLVQGSSTCHVWLRRSVTFRIKFTIKLERLVVNQTCCASSKPLAMNANF